jgi:hypothetical protein
VCSILKYEPREEEAKRRRHKWADERGAEAYQIPKRDWRGFSYGYLLNAPLYKEVRPVVVPPLLHNCCCDDVLCRSSNIACTIK